MFRCFVRLIVERGRPTEVAVGGGEVGVEREGAPEFRRRYIGLPLVRSCKAEGEMCPWVAIIEFGRPGSKGRGLLQLRLPLGASQKPEISRMKANVLCAGA